MSKRSNGAATKAAPARGDGLGGAGIHRQPSVLVRAPQWLLDLVDDATAHSNCDNRQDWIRTSLAIQAAEELGLDPVAALRGERKPA